MYDENVKAIYKKRLEKTADNLRRNRMECHIVDNASEAKALVETMLVPGSVVACGGSMTLNQCGIMELLRSGSYKFLDRAGLTGDAIKKCYRESFFADTYLMSANAITETGMLYNVDGNSNRVAALCYGPDSVIVVAGVNKIVPTLDDAIMRVKKVAAPANAVRLGCEVYCREKGECMSCASGSSAVSSGCRSESRICCNYVSTGYQRTDKRIKVILVCEELGY